MSRVVHILLVAVLLHISAEAAARRTIVVLDFGGAAGPKARGLIVSKLKRAYRVLPGSDLLSALESLGLEMKRGDNLAKACAQVGAVAVVGGSASRSRLAVAVYGGDNGDVIDTGAFRWRPGRPARAAIRLINKALRKAPRRLRSQKKKAPVEKPPSLTFEPDAIERAGSDTPDGQDSSGDRSGDEKAQTLGDIQVSGNEDPIAAAQRKKEAEERAAAELAKQAERKPGEERVWARIGFGTLMRTLSLNDAVRDERNHPNYSSGSSVAMRLLVRVRPMSFFLEGFLTNFWLQLSYETTLGLKSSITGDASDLSTTISEVLFDGGYTFKIGDELLGPEIDAFLGYGSLGLSIDWGGVDAAMPGVSYGFLYAGGAFRYPFATFSDTGFIGVSVSAHYRLIFGAGEIENTDADRWYGPAFVGGLGGGAAFYASYMRITVSAGYRYTRMFYSFSDAEARRQAKQRAAGGALDQIHSIIADVGYSY